ncbi:hypothetical protein ACWC1L_12315, partial [Streptomyces albidoflavus]
MAVRLLGTGRREEGRCDGGAAYDTRARAGALSASTIRRGRGRAGPGPGGSGGEGGGVLLLGHPDGAFAAACEELGDHRFVT